MADLCLALYLPCRLVDWRQHPLIRQYHLKEHLGEVGVSLRVPRTRRHKGAGTRVFKWPLPHSYLPGRHSTVAQQSPALIGRLASLTGRAQARIRSASLPDPFLAGRILRDMEGTAHCYRRQGRYQGGVSWQAGSVEDRGEQPHTPQMQHYPALGAQRTGSGAAKLGRLANSAARP